MTHAIVFKANYILVLSLHQACDHFENFHIEFNIILLFKPVCIVLFLAEPFTLFIQKLMKVAPTAGYKEATEKTE